MSGIVLDYNKGDRMITEKEIKEVKEYLTFLNKSYRHLAIWYDENHALYDDKDAMLQYNNYSKVVDIVTNDGLISHDYKEIMTIGGTYTPALYFMII